MLIIVDKYTKQEIDNQGTNSLFPDGNIPNIKLKSNEQAIRIRDDSDLAKKIMLANKYDFIFDKDGAPIDIVTHKTHEQARKEREESIEFKKQLILDELSALDASVPRVIEDIIEEGKFKKYGDTQKTIDRKKELRVQLSRF